MRLKRFVTAVICGVMLISGGDIGRIVTYANENTETNTEDAGETLEINKDNFPDDVLRAYLIKEFDEDGNGKINPEKVNYISINGDGNEEKVKSLEGIELLQNLNTIAVENSNLTDIDISSNKELNWLELSNNMIEEIDISHNPELMWFDISFNPVKEINIDGNEMLHMSNSASYFTVMIDETQSIKSKNKCINVEIRVAQKSGTIELDKYNFDSEYLYDVLQEAEESISKDVLSFDKAANTITYDFTGLKKSDYNNYLYNNKICNFGEETGSVSIYKSTYEEYDDSNISCIIYGRRSETDWSIPLWGFESQRRLNIVYQASYSSQIKEKTEEMYRLYNPNSGEHFYTANATERDNLVGYGWRYEGVGWNAPVKSDFPVYRLYNPNAGDHHYTTSVDEKDNLVSLGWKYEGIGWYSTGTDGQALLRLYNPNATGAGAHHYTTSVDEKDNLVSLGWKYEGIGWYGGK
ncbi:MAG: hypothetical protein IJV15_06455 [Lachnospiraceae bacterium]|nr:hypothetical protein [Lachnospiraceae bacterium]